MGSGEDSNSFRWFLEEVNRVRMFVSISILFVRSGGLESSFHFGRSWLMADTILGASIKGTMPQAKSDRSEQSNNTFFAISIASLYIQ